MIDRKKIEAFLRRVTALSFALLLLAQSGAAPQTARAEEIKPQVREGSVWKWTRGLAPENTERWYPTLLIWRDEQVAGTGMFMSGSDRVGSYNYVRFVQVNQYGGGYYENTTFEADDNTRLRIPTTAYLQNNPEIIPGAQVFYTESALSGVWTKYAGSYADKADWNVPSYKIALSNSNGARTNWFVAQEKADDLYFKEGESNAYAWAFYPRGGDQYCIVAYDDGFLCDDLFLVPDPNAMYYSVEESREVDATFFGVNSGWGAGSMSRHYLDVYWGEQTTITYYGSETIGNNMTLTIDGDATLWQNNAFTVEDGGVLVVTGTLYNNGTIRVEKGGTLILTNGATVMPYNTAARNGTVINDGGTVIVQSGAKILCDGKYEQRSMGRTYNFGAVIASRTFTAMGSRTFQNKGQLITGYTVDPGQSGQFCAANVTSSNFIGRREVLNPDTPKKDGVY